LGYRPKSSIRTGSFTVKRSIDLICQLEQNEFGLEKLQKLLSNFYLFKKFLPEGAYPVGHELLEREESHEHEAMKEAAAEVRIQNIPSYS